MSYIDTIHLNEGRNHLKKTLEVRLIDGNSDNDHGDGRRDA